MTYEKYLATKDNCTCENNGDYCPACQAELDTVYDGSKMTAARAHIMLLRAKRHRFELPPYLAVTKANFEAVIILDKALEQFN